VLQDSLVKVLLWLRKILATEETALCIKAYLFFDSPKTLSPRNRTIVNCVSVRGSWWIKIPVLPFSEHRSIKFMADRMKPYVESIRQYASRRSTQSNNSTARARRKF
jgi:hypothetical protein